MWYCSQEFEVVQTLWGEAPGGRFEVGYDVSLAGNEREVEKGERVILVLVKEENGCWHSWSVFKDTPENRKMLLKVAAERMPASRAASRPTSTTPPSPRR